MLSDPSSLLSLLLSSLAAGVALGILYDVIRISRVLMGMNHYVPNDKIQPSCPKFCRKPRKSCRPRLSAVLFQAVLVVQDILYCLAVGAVTAVLMFYHNDGVFRGFAVVGILCGIAAYLLTVGKLVIRASEYVVFAIKTAVLYAVYYVTWPLITVSRAMWRTIVQIIQKIQNKRSEKKIAAYHKKQLSRLKAAAQKGFLT